MLAREAWGHGYATETARALVRAAFDQLSASRVYATCDVANRASARVLEKAGLRREAMLERHVFAKGVWWTSFLYAIARVDWAPDPV
jgi:RimJ/RimL family protein N-acetyltransferase